jgi:hypothetical protein
MLLQRGQPMLAGWRETGGPAGDDLLILRLGDGRLFSDGYEIQP